MAYNAKADILLPYVHHHGEISEDLQKYYRECFAFVRTEDGMAKYESVLECLRYVER